MCVFVCMSHTCRNLNFAKNVTTLLHWADDMKCLINSVKNSSSKKKKKNPYLPTYLPYFCSARYANITIFFFWPYIIQNILLSLGANAEYSPHSLVLIQVLFVSLSWCSFSINGQSCNETSQCGLYSAVALSLFKKNSCSVSYYWVIPV